jgi:hypothetical protein
VLVLAPQPSTKLGVIRARWRSQGMHCLLLVCCVALIIAVNAQIPCDNEVVTSSFKPAHSCTPIAWTPHLSSTSLNPISTTNLAYFSLSIYFIHERELPLNALLRSTGNTAP